MGAGFSQEQRPREKSRVHDTIELIIFVVSPTATPVLTNSSGLQDDISQVFCEQPTMNLFDHQYIGIIIRNSVRLPVIEALWARSIRSVMSVHTRTDVPCVTGEFYRQHVADQAAVGRTRLSVCLKALNCAGTAVSLGS